MSLVHIGDFFSIDASKARSGFITGPSVSCVLGKPATLWSSVALHLWLEAVPSGSPGPRPFSGAFRNESKDRCTTSCTPPLVKGYLSGMPRDKGRFLAHYAVIKGLRRPPSLHAKEQGDHVTLGYQQALARCSRLKSILGPPTPPRYWPCLAAREIVIGGRAGRGGQRGARARNKRLLSRDNKDD